ncbi:MAG: glutathione S-transferase family protein [Sinimarinibacterium flocculans]|uniref:glutathione S-transferase family protein n=1 Tax=Sinimarinibacterium flocculans TaxID=985250 RepID=UPI003C57BCBD
MYTAYVSDVSYYSGKLEAYLRYARIAYRRVEINTRVMRETILPATGFMKVPCMQCPDGRWLKDTTPMIAWLDAQHGAPSIYPDDPAQRFLALLVEDYADEWLWRPAMYFRWNFGDSHGLLRRRLGRDLSAGTWHSAALLGWFMRWRQYLVYVRGDGVRRHNASAVQALYARTLAQLEELLRERPFLLGSRPGIVDFGYFASMFRHFALDPHSAKQMVDTAPNVYAWVGRVWAARADREGRGAFASFDDAAWDAVFAEIGRDYLRYLDANARAYAAGRRRFDLTLDDARYPRMPVVRYRVACREQLLKAYRALPADAQQAVLGRTRDSGVASWLQDAADIPAGLDAEFELPLRQRYPGTRWYGLRVMQGTPWDLPQPPIRSEPVRSGQRMP